MINRLNKNSIFSPTFFHLFFINLFFFLGITSLSILPAHLNNIGATKSYIGFFMNIQSLELVIFVIFFGKFSNKINRKQFLFIGFFLFFVSMFFMFLFHNNLILLLFFRTISSIAFAFGFTLIFSLFHDIIPSHKRRGGVGIFGISGLIASPTGAFLGEKTLQNFGPKYLFIQAAIFSLISIILILFFKEKITFHQGKDSITIWDIIKKKEIIPIVLISLIHGGAFGIFISFIPNFSEIRLGIANLSYFLIAYSLIAISTRLFFFKFIDKISRRLLLTFSLFCILFAMIIALALKAKWQLFLMGFSFGLGHSILFPTLSSSFINMVKDEERNISNNVYLATSTFGTVLFSTGFGFIGDVFGMSSIFFSMCLAISLGIIIALFDKHV